MSFNTQKCCHLVSEPKTFASAYASAFHQFLIYSASEANKIQYSEIKKNFCTTLIIRPSALDLFPPPWNSFCGQCTVLTYYMCSVCFFNYCKWKNRRQYFDSIRYTRHSTAYVCQL